MQPETTGGARGQPYPANSPGTLEMIVIWSVTIILTAAIFLTHVRLPLSEFYNVSLSGLAGGGSRALTYLNYPVAFIAIAMIGIAFALLYSVRSSLSTNFKTAIGILTMLALSFSLVAGIPGVVRQSNLDARVINVIPAIGVLLAIVLTVIALRARGTVRPVGWTGFDWVRTGITALIGFLSLPWILAYFGFYIGDVPLLGNLFMSRQVGEGETLAAVHLGAHHGMDGALFFLAGLWLTRELVRIRPEWLRWSLSAYVALMIAYGSWNATQDFWLEQVVKRGSATVEVPNAVVPALTPAWGIIGVMVLILSVVLIRASAPDTSVEAEERWQTPIPSGGRMQRTT
jgi:hypothetical protein